MISENNGMGENAKNVFNYETAFSRNIGWLTKQEQQLLMKKKVAIAGLGGVGGHYAEVLARLGVCRFHIADFDHFEIQNFNRQNCSGLSSLHKSKASIIKEKILDINPFAEVKVFEQGLNTDNIQEFLEGTDLYLDGLDFFVLDIRQLVFDCAQKLQIPALTVAPVGMGASLVFFEKNSKSFAEHFGLHKADNLEKKAIRFLIGLTPNLKHLKYLVDPSAGNFRAKRAPSVPMGPYLCAGIAGTEALKILLGRGSQKGSPWILHFDAYLQNYHKSYLWLGHRNPLQFIKYKIIERILRANS